MPWWFDIVLYVGVGVLALKLLLVGLYFYEGPPNDDYDPRDYTGGW